MAWWRLRRHNLVDGVRYDALGIYSMLEAVGARRCSGGAHRASFRESSELSGGWSLWPQRSQP